MGYASSPGMTIVFLVFFLAMLALLTWWLFLPEPHIPAPPQAACAPVLNDPRRRPRVSLTIVHSSMQR